MTRIDKRGRDHTMTPILAQVSGTIGSEVYDTLTLGNPQPVG